jgi:DNA-binding MarR family transcriptional regulator
MPQIITLHILQTQGQRSVSEIAGCTNLSLAATSHLVDRLVKLNLVDRMEDEHDRRQKCISISERGLNLMKKLLRARQQVFAAALGHLRVDTMLQLTGCLAQALAEIRSPPSLDVEGTPTDHEAH